MKRYSRIFLTFVPALLGVAGLLVFSGCESFNSDSSGVDEYFDANPYQSETREEPSPHQLQVTPTVGTTSLVGQELLFTGKGGTPPYRWSLSDSSKGTVSVVGWSQCRYQCRQVGNNTLRLEDSQGHFAVARITPVQDSMTVHPSEVDVELAAGGMAQLSFSVNGGSPPYVWSVGNPALGTVSYSASATHKAAYTGVRDAYGINIITVRDSEGRTAHATVTTEPK